MSLSEVLDVTEIVESGMKYLPLEYTVAYLLKARTVEAEKQPLLGSRPYTCSKERIMYAVIRGWQLSRERWKQAQLAPSKFIGCELDGRGRS
jgi:hypothetical protein